jgi:SRSO17 transposase
VSAQISIYGPETTFAVPQRNGSTGRPRTVARPDRKPESVRALAERLPKRAWRTLPCRTAPDGEQIKSRFAFVRVVATHPVRNNNLPPREEWLIIEWPPGADAPTDYWLSNLPPNTPRERLARLARLRWTIELDYRQLKGELGLDHYEGRSYPGFHHHCALVTCAHAFLTLERQDPKAPRPACHSRRRCCSCSPSCAAGPAAAEPANNPSTSNSSRSSADVSNKVLLRGLM